MLSSFEDVHKAADEASHQQKTSRNTEADIVVPSGLENPTVNWWSYHGGEASEECKEAKSACKVIKSKKIHQNNGGQGYVGS